MSLIGRLDSTGGRLLFSILLLIIVCVVIVIWQRSEAQSETSRVRGGIEQRNGAIAGFLERATK